MTILLRDEARPTERRTAITPNDAKTLVDAGIRLEVESSKKRIFTDAEYAAAGAQIVATGSWMMAAPETTILGLKELPATPAVLPHKYIHFAHLFKNQSGWENEVKRFQNGDGYLFDLEYLTLNGRRTAAFGYWAGWMGAALAAWRYLALKNNTAGPKNGVQSFSSKSEVIEILNGARNVGKAIVIGAKGRSGTGATEALKIAGFTVTEWDMAETKNLDKEALFAHDILVNCVMMTGPGLTLMTKDDIVAPNNQLQIISDVSCDPFSDFNPLPIYSQPTSWNHPFVELGTKADGSILELTAIDNLPSLLPRESSEDFSAQLLPSLMNYPNGDEWKNATNSFVDATKRAQ